MLSFSIISENDSSVRRGKLSVLLTLGTALATFLAFLPALRNGFMDVDDWILFVTNPYYRGLGWDQLRWAFGDSVRYGGHFIPLSWLTLSADYVLWGMDPFGYHLTSLLLHCANATLFFLTARRLLTASSANTADDRWLSFCAAFAALLFSLHPLRVESVAWATERRDVLSGFFYLASVLCYLKSGTAVRHRGWYLACVGFFVLGLLSKINGIMLPLVFLTLDVYPLRRLPADPRTWLRAGARAVWLEKLPLLGAAVAAGAAAFAAESLVGSVRSLGEVGLAGRAILGAFSPTFYLWKTLVPLRLLPLYELPIPFDPWQARWLLPGVATIALTAFLWIRRARSPGAWTAWLAYLLVLAPVSGLVTIGSQVAADRNTYLPNLIAAVCGGGLLLRQRSSRLATPVAFVLVIGLGAAAWRQCRVWRDPRTLWTHVLGINPECVTAHYNYGASLVAEGRLEEATEHFRQALRLQPDFPLAHNYLAAALASQGHTSAAFAHYMGLLRVSPTLAPAHNGIGYLLAQRGFLPEAISRYERALAIEPNFPEARNNLGLALAGQGRYREAIEQFGRAVEINPRYLKARINLGWAPAGQGRIDEAIVHYEKALEIAPDSALARGNLERALALKRESGR